MAYIEELRKLIGHKPIIMAGAAVLVTDAQGRLLMGQRSDNHQWGIPGGSMEPGETLEETARRETEEETGLKIVHMELFGVYSGPEFFYTYPNGDQVYNVSVVYISSDYQGAVQLPAEGENEEHSSFRFFAADELPDAITPPIRPVIRQWAEQQVKA